jgi:hypothetical protein
MISIVSAAKSRLVKKQLKKLLDVPAAIAYEASKSF